MRSFTLPIAGQDCSCDTDGRVLDAASKVIGQWTTTDENKIRVAKVAGDHVEIAVDWEFNEFNQLTISQGAKLLFVVLNTVDGLPRFRLQKNVLVVDPDGDGDFQFNLRCLFGMNGDGNLVVSINGKESVLDGYIEDSKSRFRFQFFDKSLKNFPNSLVFTGAWEKKPVATEIRLHFKLADPALEIPGKLLDLPAALRVDPTRNHLALVYQSASHGERSIQFQGSFDIKPGFTLVFTISDVKDGSVQKSRVEVQTTFEWDVAKGALSLYVGKTKTAKSQEIQIGGALQVELKKGTLNWTLAYQKSTAGLQSVVTIATALEFKSEQGKIMIEYKQNGATKQLDVTGRLVKENFALAGGVAIKDDPQGRRVKAFVGIAW